MEEDLKPLQVPCLSNLYDLQKLCAKENIKISSDTNRYLLFLTLKKLGPLVSQKLIKRLVQAGDFKWDKEEDFEVEAILNYHKDPENGLELYFIKWKNWTHEHNTWEPKDHISEDLLVKFHSSFDPSQPAAVYAEGESCSSSEKVKELMERICKTTDITSLKLLSAANSPKKPTDTRYAGLLVNGPPRTVKPKPVSKDISNKRSKAHRDMKREIQLALKDWENHINSINTGAPVYVENTVDLDGPPENFTYINDYKPMPGVILNEEPVIGCECTNCFDEKKTCCAANAGCQYAFYKNSRVRVHQGLPIYECNKLCKCPQDCPNRVVQNGRKHKVCIFKTVGRGWGVKAMQKIKKGSFVMEYVGEIITNEEAERRGLEYDAEGRTYLFDLDYNDPEAPYTVDAGFYGNESHFVNHCCDPNMVVYGVWINNLDPSLPRIALFAKRDIKNGEELTFDYLMTGDTTQAADVVKAVNECDMNMLGIPTPDSGDMKDDVSTDTGIEEPVSMDTSEASGTDSAIADTVAMDTTDTSSNPPAADAKDGDDFKIPFAINNRPPGREQDQGSDVSEVASRAGSEAESGIGDVLEEGSRREEGSRGRGSARAVSPSPAAKYRLMCQCGAKNCRKYLY